MATRLLTKGRKAVRVLVTAPWRRALLRHRVAAAVEHFPILRRLGELRTVVDIGANRGQFALVARRVWPDARIVSFEPLSGAASVFRVVFRGDARTRIEDAAIAPRSGAGTLHVSRRDDSSSLLPIGRAQRELFPGTDEIRTVGVRVAPLGEYLDAAMETPALLKLDVQGYELEALRGCEDLLDRFQWVYVECSYVELYEGQALAGEVEEWLVARGYVPRGIHNPIRDRSGRLIQADFLFDRTEG